MVVWEVSILVEICTTTINVNDKFRILPSTYLYIRFGWIAIRETLIPLKLAEVVAKW